MHSFTQRLSDDDDTAPLPVLPRPSSSAAASAFRAAPLTCRSRPTPRGLVEFYSWWTVVERVGPVAIRSAPPSTTGISGAVRCDFCGDSSGRVVGAAAPPPRPARRPPAQLRRTTTSLATSPDADAQRRLTGRQQTKHPIQTGRR